MLNDLKIRIIGDMVNDYKTLDEAIQAWKNDRMWAFGRTYFNRTGSACVCQEGKRFFIITHPDCVAYRKSIGQFIQDLNPGKFTVWVHTGKRKGRTASGWDVATREEAESLQRRFKKSGSRKVTIEERNGLA